MEKNKNKLQVIDDALRSKELSELNIVTKKGRVHTGAISGKVLIIVDYSSSMGCSNGEEDLYQIVDRHLEEFPDIRKIYIWASEVVEEKPQSPSGGTPLHLGLRKAKELGFKEVIVISDGEPDNQNLCFEAAKDLKISVIFVGTNQSGQFFLERLAQHTGGQYKNVDLGKALLSEQITLMLPQTGSKSINL